MLVLGSMPGEASLRSGQYYAHPRNAFWRIAGDLLGFAPETPYDERLEQLIRARIALWDVLQSCRRVGSLDAKIDPASVVPNDFAAFVTAHTSLRRICFNGALAERLFRRHVQPRLAADRVDRLEIVRLPSTSPAHAALDYAAKRSAWRVMAAMAPPPAARRAQRTRSRRPAQEPRRR